jgi:quaternary ammonium compound-resistance protein SugE
MSPRREENDMAWIYLLLAGLLEIVWAVGLKYSDGFTKPAISVFTLATMALGFWLLALALREIPLGTGYAVWVGIGAVGTAILGIVLFGEPAAWPRLACIGLICAGIVGLKLATP